MPAVELPSVTLRYRRSGSGTPVVFLHDCLIGVNLSDPVIRLLDGGSAASPPRPPMKLGHPLRRLTPRLWITRYWHNRALLDEYWDAHPELVEVGHANHAAEGGVVRHSGSRVDHTDPQVPHPQRSDR